LPVREARRLALLSARAPPATPERPCWGWSGGAPSCRLRRPGPGRNRWIGEQRGTGTREELGPPSPRSALAAVDPSASVCQARREVTAINRSYSSCRTAGWAGRCCRLGCRLSHLLEAGPGRLTRRPTDGGKRRRMAARRSRYFMTVHGCQAPGAGNTTYGQCPRSLAPAVSGRRPRPGR